MPFPFLSARLLLLRASRSSGPSSSRPWAATRKSSSTSAPSLVRSRVRPVQGPPSWLTSPVRLEPSQVQTARRVRVRTRKGDEVAKEEGKAKAKAKGPSFLDEKVIDFVPAEGVRLPVRDGVAAVPPPPARPVFVEKAVAQLPPDAPNHGVPSKKGPPTLSRKRITKTKTGRARAQLVLPEPRTERDRLPSHQWLDTVVLPPAPVVLVPRASEELLSAYQNDSTSIPVESPPSSPPEDVSMLSSRTSVPLSAAETLCTTPDPSHAVSGEATSSSVLSPPPHDVPASRAHELTQQESIEQPLDLSPKRGLGHWRDSLWTTTDLEAALTKSAADAASDGGRPWRTLAPHLATVTRLTEPDQTVARSAFRRVYELTRTADEAAEVASWLIRVTENEPNASVLLYEAMQGTIRHLSSLSPRPPPDVYLALFASHETGNLKAFKMKKNPLVLLLEVYTRLYAQDERRLDPLGGDPSPADSDEIERLRAQHLKTTRKIHQAIKEVGGRILTQRSTGSLMEAYNHGRSFSDVQEIWEAAGGVGGTGVDQQAVANYFDACGFSGALPEALVAWERLQAEGFAMQENTYSAYHECLTRCGAWTDLVAAFRDQHARHLADPTSTFPVTASEIAGSIKLATRLVRNPRRRSLHPVDLDAFKRLRAELRAIVSEDVWAETERFLASRERLPSASKEVPFRMPADPPAASLPDDPMSPLAPRPLANPDAPDHPVTPAIPRVARPSPFGADASLDFPTPTAFRLLHNAGFKFASLTSSPEAFLAGLDQLTETQLAWFSPESREDNDFIRDTFRTAVTLDQSDRKRFLASQDAAQERARERQQTGPVVWTTAVLVAALSDPDTLLSKMASVTRLTEPDQTVARSAFNRLHELTRTAEEAVEVASWIIRVTENERNASDLLYEAMQATIRHLSSLSPRPPPDVYLALFASHESRISKAFTLKKNPLVLLVEVYTRLFIHNHRRLDPVAQSPSADALAEIERLRIGHLETTRKIHQAIKELGGAIFTQRSTGSLLDAFNYGKSFSDVQAVWEVARGVGGTGVDQQAAAIYFDACGFNGALSEALVAWKELLAEGFSLDQNDYAAYHECLTRCGAWTELVAAYRDQHARHLADPTSTFPVTASEIAGSIKLANRLVREPRRRSLHPVDLDAFKRLRAELRAIVSEDVWAETERFLASPERSPSASKGPMTAQR